MKPATFQRQPVCRDPVNTVFRLEGVMKELNQQLLLSADFAEHLPESEKLVDLGERKLKGKQQLVRIFGPQ